MLAEETKQEKMKGSRQKSTDSTVSEKDLLMTKELPDFTLKLVIVGNAMVGKTNIMEQYATGTFHQQWITTLGFDFRSKIIEIKQQKIQLNIWDTAGQERFGPIVSTNYRGAHGIILVYDITDQTSFNDISRWMEHIKQNSAPDIQIILVGNKADLEENRRVNLEQGKHLADAFGVLFFETSAKTNMNIQKTFLTITKSIIEQPSFKQTNGRKMTLLTEDDELPSKPKQSKWFPTWC